jgi:hypothetical protein
MLWTIFLDFGLGLICYQSTSDTKLTRFSGLYNGNNALISVYGNYLEARRSTINEIENLR